MSFHRCFGMLNPSELWNQLLNTYKASHETYLNCRAKVKGSDGGKWVKLMLSTYMWKQLYFQIKLRIKSI